MSDIFPEHAPNMLKCDTVASEHTGPSEHVRTCPNMLRTCFPEHAQMVTLLALQSLAQDNLIQTQSKQTQACVSSGVFHMYACSFIDMLLVLFIRTMSEHSPNMVRTHSEHDEPGKGCGRIVQMESGFEPSKSIPKQTSS